MTKIAVIDDYQDAARVAGPWDSLPAGSDVTFFHDHLADEGQLVERLAEFEIVVAMRERTAFRRSLLERLPRLKLLVTTGARNASIDVAAANDRGVVVCGTRGLPTGTAELTWGLILALARSIPAEDRAVREGRWQTTVGADIAGKTLGVVGLGSLGSQVATVGKAFRMEVIAWSQNLTDERAAALGCRRVSKEELFSQSDYISIHLVLSDRSRGLIGADDLARMKPTAFLVNTSRGPIVDEAALLGALQERRIAGAGLDVFSEEPLPAGHPWVGLENVVLTPHLGYVTQGGYGVFYGDAVEDIAAFLAGTPVRVIQP